MLYQWEAGFGKFDGVSYFPYLNKMIMKREPVDLVLQVICMIHKLVSFCLYGILYSQVGNRSLLTENGIAIPTDVENFVVELEESANTGILVAYGAVLIGVLGVADPLKREAAVVVEVLMKMGVRPIMVTGDNWRTAQAVAKKVRYIFV